jgi:serine/threonine protein kinase
MPRLEEGQIFERYFVIRWLGSGVSGESYEAKDVSLQHKVTLKLIHPWSLLPDSARRQFFREMQVISRLNHPYLASVLDYGENNGILYVVRRYTTSGSLLGSEGRTWFHPPLDVLDAIHYVYQLAQALEYIHSRGCLHGALSFANILILRGPNIEDDPKHAPFLLADVGLANFVHLFGQPRISLLPITAAPEQIGKRVTAASDQFALAVLLFSWLAGRPPYLGSPEEVEQLKLTETIASLHSLNSKVSSEQEEIVRRALAVYPDERYPSILSFAEALLATITPQSQLITQHKPESLIFELNTQLELINQSRSAAATELAAVPDTTTEPIADLELNPTEANPVFQPPAIPESTPAPDIPTLLPELILAPEALPEPVSTPNLQSEPVTVQPEQRSAPEPWQEPAFTPTLDMLLALLGQTKVEEEREGFHIQDLPAPQAGQPIQEMGIRPPEQDATRVPTSVELSSPDLTREEPSSTIQAESPPGLACLIITSPYTAEPGEVYLEHKEITLGRAGSSDILLDYDSQTSRHHALLKRENNHYVIYDRRSISGVFINGQKLAGDRGQKLSDGDQIRIGNYELIFRSGTQSPVH